MLPVLFQDLRDVDVPLLRLTDLLEVMEAFLVDWTALRQLLPRLVEATVVAVGVLL